MGRSLRSKAHQVLITELRQAREDAGMTQQALADLMDRPQSYVAKIEIGERSIDLIELLEWTRATKADRQSIIAAIEGAMTASQN